MNVEQKVTNKLLKLKEDNWLMNHEEILPFTWEILPYLESVNSELRDSLVLEFIWFHIYENHYTIEALLEILKTLLSDQYLFFNISFKQDDSVFKRSFSALIIAQIVSFFDYHDYQSINILQFDNILEKIIYYTEMEHDYRGYVEHKGFAHSMAHVADAMRELSKSKFITHNQLVKLLDVIKKKFAISDYVYINEESERFTSAIINIINQNVFEKDYFANWIKSFKIEPDYVDIHFKHYYKENIKNLLRSIYFRYKSVNNEPMLLDLIEDVLNHINKNYNQV